MKIKKMTAYFGALNGESLELREGLNILYAPNESGKSTWCAFLRTMLYGLSTAQRARAGQKPDKVKYRPWSGIPMSGSMDVETGRGPVTLRRWTEKAAQPMQAFSATVTGTETPVPGMTAESAGELLTGVTREVYERSAFIRQSGLVVTADPELEKRVNATISSGDEEISYTQTNERLKKWRNRRRSGRRGALLELESELESVRARLDSIRQRAAERASLEELIQQAQEEQVRAEAALEQAKKKARRAMLADISRARVKSREAEKICQEARESLFRAEEVLETTPFRRIGPEEARLQGDTSAENIRTLTRLAARIPPRKIAFIPLGLACAAFLLALAPHWRMECIGAGCVLMLLFVVMYTRLTAMEKTKAETLEDRQRILDYYGIAEPEEMDGLLERYRALWTERERAAFRQESAEEALQKARETQKRAEERIVNDIDLRRWDADCARAGQAVETGKRRLEALKERRAELDGQLRVMGDPMALESSMAQLRRRHEEISRQEEALNLAMEVLAAADGELQERFSPLLAKETAALFARLTAGRYDEITLARDLAAKARRAGDAVGWETDYLSEGTRDQLYLALRLAVCRLALPEEEPCPIVLDDALVAFDRERMALALELLREIARTRQVLVFTCHEREYTYFAKDPAVATLRLGGEEKNHRKKGGSIQ